MIIFLDYTQDIMKQIYILLSLIIISSLSNGIPVVQYENAPIKVIVRQRRNQNKLNPCNPWVDPNCKVAIDFNDFIGCKICNYINYKKVRTKK